jgi:hypothetical protein
MLDRPLSEPDREQSLANDAMLPARQPCDLRLDLRTWLHLGLYVSPNDSHVRSWDEVDPRSRTRDARNVPMAAPFVALIAQ